MMPHRIAAMPVSPYPIYHGLRVPKIACRIATMPTFTIPYLYRPRGHSKSAIAAAPHAAKPAFASPYFITSAQAPEINNRPRTARRRPVSPYPIYDVRTDTRSQVPHCRNARFRHIPFTASARVPEIGNRPRREFVPAEASPLKQVQVQPVTVDSFTLYPAPAPDRRAGRRYAPCLSTAARSRG